MSEVPSTPPELSCPGDTPADSLLERLRRITGITELEPLRDQPRTTVPAGSPPVDRLIPWLRDGFAALTAGGIAVAVATTAGTLWLWARGREGVRRVNQWQRERASRAAKATAAPIQERAPADTLAVNPRALTPPLPDVVTPVIAMPAPSESVQVLAEPGAIAAVPSPSNSLVSPMPVAPVRERAARRRPLAAAILVILALPSLLLVKPVRYHFISLMGWGNAAVIAGKDGWLFPRVESEPAVAAPPPLRETAAALQAYGATLVVVSVPAKSAVYPEKLAGSGGGELHRQPHIATALSELAAAGARVIDLGPVFFELKKADETEGHVFMPECSWWSPRCMAQGAFAAANFIQQQPGYASLPLRPAMATLQPCTGNATMDDLVASLESDRLQRRYPARSLPLIRLLTAEQRGPLAPDPASPVALLGGEPVGIYDDPKLGHVPAGLPGDQRVSAGFGQHLAWHLSITMDQHVTPGGGLRAARDWLSSRSEEERRKKKLVVWVLADSDLLRGE